MLEAIISDICALQKKGGAQLRIPPEFDPRFHADAYNEEHVGPLQPSGDWSTFALQDQRRSDADIEAYENAVVVYCLAGCRQDCRPRHLLDGGEPRTVERRYLLIEGRQLLLCFDVNAVSQTKERVTRLELEGRVAELAAVTRWWGLRDYLAVKGYSLLIAGRKPRLTHQPLRAASSMADWSCQQGQYVIARTVWNNGSGEATRYADEWWFGAEAARTPRPAVATSTPPKKEPVEWLFYTECGNHARARRRRKAGEFPLPKPRWPASSRGSQPCNPQP